MKEVTLIIDNSTLEKYEEYYFSIHKRAKKKPIAHPYHESINTWMVLHRQAMNNLKQKWKEFIVWFVENEGYTGYGIDKCTIRFRTYFGFNRRHDSDNTVPKFILDGFVDSGIIVDDDCLHVKSLILECDTDVGNPRTEITISYDESKEDKTNG